MIPGGSPLNGPLTEVLGIIEPMRGETLFPAVRAQVLATNSRLGITEARRKAEAIIEAWEDARLMGAVRKAA